MPEAPKCPHCGSPLPSAGWEGLCPKCVVRVALETSADAQGESALPECNAPAPLQPHSPLPGSPDVGESLDPRAALSKSDFVIDPTGMTIGRYKLLDRKST